MRLNTKSLIFKSALIFLLMTILNIGVFVLMIFENQIDLIIKNSLLNSQITASQFQFTINNILGTDRILTDERIQKTLAEARKSGIDSFTIFSEEGTILAAIEQGQPANPPPATLEELKQINTALTRRAFENKAFSQKILDGTHNLQLYIPFNLAKGKQAVVMLKTQMDDINEQMSFLYRQCLVIALVILLIHGTYAFFIFRQIFLPLRALLRGARSISMGNLETRVPIVRSDEIGELAGAFNEMSVAIRNMHDEARGANPLSGLPGNITIAKAMDKRLEEGGYFAVLYSDLDNFKAYNDKYGFTRGDDAIIFVRDCLLQVKENWPNNQIFIGHEGGDDFVVVIDYDIWKDYCETFLARFDAGVPQFYNRTDATNGYIESVNRQGVPMRFPLMSISIAVVSNRFRHFGHHAEMVQVAAEVKKLAKKKEGSSYVEDTRGRTEETGVLVKQAL